MSDKIFSSHIFMFPFRFDWNDDGFENEFAFYNKNRVEERIDLSRLNNKLVTNDWIYEKFEVDKDVYNEFAYFYDYARDGIYNLRDFSENSISNFYRKKEFDEKIFELNIFKQKEPYKLVIEAVTLRVFNTGVAILSIELKNDKYSKFSDILNINDYGRRIYPQFIGNKGIKDTKDAFLANSIKIGDIEEKFEYEDFSDTKIGDHIMEVLSKDIFTQDKNNIDHYYIQPSLDDRMFVLSWYGNSEIVSKLKNYQDCDDWYKYIFIDNADVTVKNNNMKIKLLADATYDRWSDDDTLYGVTRYSFVCLTNRKWFPVNIIRPHMSSMYFQMITLLLAIRTSILRFSDEIASLTSDKEFDVEKLTKLYKKYLIFYNRLYFKEVTHQDQGIELYDMARKQMKIDEHMEKLDGKFTKLFDFADLIATKNEQEIERKKLEQEKRAERIRNKGLDNLTKLGALFAPPSLMVALLSMSIFDYEQSYKSLGIGLFAIVLSSILGYFIMKSLLSKDKSDE